MANEELISLMEQAIAAQQAPLIEELDRVKAQYSQLAYEDLGWKLVSGQSFHDTEGLTLDTLHEVSKRLREDIAGSPLPKQANILRLSYTFTRPLIIPGMYEPMERDNRGRKPAKPYLQDFVTSRTLQKYVFGKKAQGLINASCSTDGHYFLLGDDTKRTVMPVPVYQIKQAYLNPDNTGEVWAYLREWDDPSKKNNPQRRWYYTDDFEGTRVATIPNSDTTAVQVDRNKTMIPLIVNPQVGWPLGVPDLMAGTVSNRNYLQMLHDGQEVSHTLAFYTAKIKNGTNTSATNAGVVVGGSRGVGKTVAGNEVDVFQSAGKVYDFDALRPIAAQYAASVGVSVVDLLASPAAAGSSYGSAQALAPGQRRGIESRRNEIAAWMERVLEWGINDPDKAVVIPASIEEVDPYRETQMGMLAWSSGLVHEDEFRPWLINRTGITMRHGKAPDGVMLPNNLSSLPRKDVDKDGQGGVTSTGATTGSTTASPGQGQSTGNGGAGSTAANDLRTDTVS